MLAVCVSRPNRASVHIGARLRELADWTARDDDARSDADGGGTYYRLDGVGTDDSGDDAIELRTFDELHLRIENAAAAYDDPDLLLFASSHAGDTGPLLTVHSTGNFGPAAHGGRDSTLATHAPNALVRVLEAFDDHAPDGYDVGIECTHHGPSSVGCPSLFVELGSDEAEWNDPAGARAVARAILDCGGVDPHRERTLVGFGGGHYLPRFERVIRETDWAVGHVAADWALDEMGDPAEHREVLAQAFDRSRAVHALVDGDRPALNTVIDELGYRVVSETWVRETTGVPLELVDEVESRLGAVAEGVRLGTPARSADPDAGFVPSELPADFLEEAVGFDRSAVREVVHEDAIAYETTEGGSRVSGAVVLPDAGDYDAVVDALADILRDKYDAVTRADDVVVVQETAFDPARARALGVPEGPAFGRLAGGEPVEVDGEWIEPAAVHEKREQRFPI